MNESTLKYIIARVIDNANETMNEARENPDDAFYKGKRLAYYEVLDTIKNTLLNEGIPLDDLGLNVELERKFL